jgi:branched-subunit amino acid transport protein
MSVWTVVLAVGVGSYLLRVVPLLIAGRITPAVERGLGRAGTAALTALVVTDLASIGPWSTLLAALAATAAGTVVAWRGGSMLRVVALGVAVHLLVGAALAA